MIRKLIVTFAVLGVLCCAVFALAAASNSSVGLPRPLEAASPCPAVGCASGVCHDYAQVPDPDGIHELSCPETGCASVECHAWETMFAAYRAPSDMSLNVWILAPVVLLLGLWAMLKKV